MDIRELITFKTIVETGSFTKTAIKLHYAQSTITAHIKELEESFGYPLFERIGKKIELTFFGKEVYGNTLELIDKFEQIKNIPSKTEVPACDLKIGSPESIMLYKLYPIVQEYRRRFPQVNVIIKSGVCNELKIRLLQGEFDISFLMEKNIDYDYKDNLNLEYFNKEKINIVASTEYKEEDIFHIENCSVLNTEKGCYYRDIFEDYLNSHSISYRNCMETESVELIKKYVMCNLGISFLPYYAVKKEVEENKIKILKTENEYFLYTVMGFSKKKWINPAMKEFIKLSREYLS